MSRYVISTSASEVAVAAWGALQVLYAFAFAFAFSTSPDNLTGVSWPVPNENLKQLPRALRSSKPEVHYRFQDSAH